jgi:pimeloyl-ACP methyl ester carboxylesterase/DNA-binding CsgD family transcriptional regulator
MEPVIHYARTSDGVNIAYFCVGTGPPLVYVPTAGSADYAWKQPQVRTWFERLSANRRVVRPDHRGIGLSDRGWKFDPEQAAADIEAVVDKEGLARFALMGTLQSAAMAVCYAVRHPDRVTHLILWCPYAETKEHLAASPALRAAVAAGEHDMRTLFDLIGLQSAGWADPSQARSFTAYLRAGGDGADYLPQEYDIRDKLGQVKAPVLVLHRRDVPFPAGEVSRRVALGVPNGQFVSLEGEALLPFFGDMDAALAAIDRFLAEPEAARTDGLTQRETEILALIAVGSSSAEIARSLTISARTVERHIQNIYRKIDARNRAEATAYAFRHSLVPPG